ncbi:MAG: GNAT family protein [bacterium]|nr:GNAT family protein [bacterium]
MKKHSTYLIASERLGLRELSPAEATLRYVHWLNDAKVQLYTRRRGKKFSLKDVRDFIASTRQSPDRHFAVFIKDGEKHIGNIFIIAIDKENKSAELSIMIGDRSVWGKGYATEAIILATKLAFKVLKLHRLWAESAHPVFNAIMRKLNWVFEGRRRDAFRMPRGYRDVDCWSVLEAEIDSK